VFINAIFNLKKKMTHVFNKLKLRVWADLTWTQERIQESKRAIIRKSFGQLYLQIAKKLAPQKIKKIKKVPIYFIKYSYAQYVKNFSQFNFSEKLKKRLFYTTQTQIIKQNFKKHNKKK